MKTANDMEEAIKKNLNFTASAEMRERILTDVMNAQEESKKTKSALIRPNIRSIIMKSQKTKLAAAAVIIIAVGICMYYFTGDGTTPLYGMSDLPELFEQAKVIHIQGWKYFGGHRMPNGKKIPPVEINNWLDLENGRSRFTYTGLSDDRNGIRIMTGESVSDGEYKMNLNHTDKYGLFSKISDYQRMLNAYRLSKLIYGQLFGEIEQLPNFKKVGHEEIDEVVYDIWQRETIHAVSEHDYRLKFWLSPYSGKIGRVQMWSKVNNDQWELNYDYCDIDYNVVVPDEVFAMEIPEDYTLKNTKETAILLELGGGGGVGYSDDQCSLRADTLIGFMMSDGSVIVAWNSVNTKSAIPQDELFMGLEFGGPLPKLPVEIYGLKPAGMSSDITYTGYHLTCTQKAGKFIEWSLYVPDGTPPASVRQLGCDVLYRFNLDHEPKWRIGLTVDCMLIETVGDFDKWVLGAMAELSDDGKAPENVTYESVLQLAKQIRS